MFRGSASPTQMSVSELATADDDDGETDDNKALFGIAKCTWAASNTTLTLDWMMKHFNESGMALVRDAPDSCADDTCKCGTQGRVYLREDDLRDPHGRSSVSMDVVNPLPSLPCS